MIHSLIQWFNLRIQLFNLRIQWSPKYSSRTWHSIPIQYCCQWVQCYAASFHMYRSWVYPKWQDCMGKISLGECTENYKSTSSTYHLVLWSMATLLFWYDEDDAWNRIQWRYPRIYQHRAFFNIQAGGGKCPPSPPLCLPTKSHFAPPGKVPFS
jgi:hypothetical protein